MPKTKSDTTASMFYTSLDEEHTDHDHLDIKLPNDMSFYDNQVAGHSNDGKHFGIVKFKEALLKPILKPALFEREAQFYEFLQRLSNDSSCNHDSLIKKLVPKYYGRNAIQINGGRIDCLVIEDLTRGIREPCIIDIKIGKRTWDPEATFEKIQREDAKYHMTKREYGLCIPGFQVYTLDTGELQKYDKRYGQQLDKDSMIEALRIFLNGRESMSRILLVQLLVNLWHIQNWARKQKQHRLYGSSILLIYDARRLRQILNLDPPKEMPAKPSALVRTNSLYRPLSLAILNDKCTKTGFSGQLNKDGPIFPCRTRTLLDCRTQAIASRKSAPNLKRMHSFHNNYDEELRLIRTDYTHILEDLVEDSKNELWATARMIDFSHAFPAESCQLDFNYLNGIENLVSILEGFLMETDG